MIIDTPSSSTCHQIIVGTLRALLRNKAYLALALDDVVAVVGRAEGGDEVRRRDAVRPQQRAQLLYGAQVGRPRRPDACAGCHINCVKVHRQRVRIDVSVANFQDQGDLRVRVRVTVRVRAGVNVGVLRLGVRCRVQILRFRVQGQVMAETNLQR